MKTKTVHGIELTRPLDGAEVLRGAPTAWQANLNNRTWLFRGITGWRSRRITKWSFEQGGLIRGFEPTLKDAVQAAIWMEEGARSDFFVGLNP